MKVKKVLQLSLATLFVATAAMGISSLQKETVFAEAAQAEWATGNSQVSVTMNYDVQNSEYSWWAFTTADTTRHKTYNNTGLAAAGMWYKTEYVGLKPMLYEAEYTTLNEYPTIHLGYYDGDFKMTSSPITPDQGNYRKNYDYMGVEYKFTDLSSGEYFTVNAQSSYASPSATAVVVTANGDTSKKQSGNISFGFISKIGGTLNQTNGTIDLFSLKYDTEANAIVTNRAMNSSFSLEAAGLTSAFDEYQVEMSFVGFRSVGRTGRLFVYSLNGYDLTEDMSNVASNGTVFYQKASEYTNEENANVDLSEVIGAWDTALGDVTAQTQYTVQDAQGADVAVENGVFVAPASGDYTVSATYGSTTKNFTVGVTIPSVSYPEGGVIVQKARLNLEGKIGVQFLVSADETVYDAEGGKVVFTVADETTEVAFTDWMASGNDYIVECEVAAKQMTDTISMQFVDKNGVVSAEMTYSVREYADTVLAGENEAAKELVKATLNYGAYAQVYFNYNVENLANAGLYEEGQNPVEGMEGVAQAAVTADSTVEGVSLKSLSLGLETETEVYVLFALAEGVAMSDVTFAVEGVNVEAVETNGGAYIVIKNVAAKDVDKDYTVTVTYGENTATYTVSAQCYISAAFGKTANTAYDNLLKAIELYNVAANAYFA